MSRFDEHTRTPGPWRNAASDHGSARTFLGDLIRFPVQRRHLSRDVEFYERIKGGSMLSFSRLEIATSKLRPIQFDPVGDNDSGRSDPILPIIRGVVFSIRFDSTRLDSDQTRRFCHRLNFPKLFLDSEMEF